MKVTTWRHTCQRLICLALLAAAICLVAPVRAHAASTSFDHATTGFELQGQHRLVACESCHTGGIFKGTPTTCVACHAAGSRIGATAKPTNHILSSSDCTQCHTTSGWRPVARFDHRNVIGSCSSCHNNVQTVGKGPSHLATTADCGGCHSVSQPWSTVTYPSNHIPTAPTAQCGDCHTGGSFSVVPSLTNIHRYAPSTSANCAQCHGAAAPTFAIPAIGFSIVGLPSGHIPLGTNTACEGCHVGAGSSIAATPVVDGAKFAGSAMSHAGITTCVSCHGPTVTAASFYGITKIVVMPATSPMGPAAHVPTGTACESCHAGSTPTGLVPGNATKSVPGTGFATPAPTTVQIHAGIAGNCSSCHEGAYQWVDVVTAYPLNPASLTTGVLQFFGFQTRPGKTASVTNLVDAAHPTSGDCSQCHTRTDYFEGQLKPANHIPTASTATCANCHKSADFSVMPALVDIHTYAPSTTANCAQCHSSANAPTFAIPAANFSIVTTPANHIPTTAACESCHVGASSSVAATPVPNGAKFANSAMNHAGLTTCVGCHGPTITGASFAGISRIIVMPATSPTGPSAHIPSPTTCETCHLGSMPVGQIPAVATKTVPGSAFATPAPTTTQIHAGISAGCASCHETPDQWLGMASYYAITPTVLTTGAKYMGFQTRPTSAAGTFNIADPAHPTSGDCSQCHAGNFQYFDGNVKPANHIPTAATAACTDCHKSTNFAVMPALVDIHTYAPSTTTNCAQCHSSANAPTFAIPAANFTIVTTPATHIPTTAACESCHVGAGSSVAATPVPNGSTFKGSAMNHAGLTTCVSCHGPSVTNSTFYGVTRIITMPATSPAGPAAHIPSGTACESCHQGSMPAGLVPGIATRTVPGTLFATPAPTTTQIHAGVSSGCASCHEAPYQWVGMATYYAISPSVLTSGAQYTGFQTRPGTAAGTFIVADPAHPTSGDCSQCHAGNFQYFDGNVKPANHIPTATTATCTNCHKSTNFAVMPALVDIHTYAPSTTTNCTQCHGSATAPTFAIPAANFSIVTTPANHIPTTAACESCHVGAGSSVAATPVPNGSTFKGSAMNHAGLTTCVGCHGPSITNSTFYGITSIITMPATSPAGPAAHIPSGTACESCHQGSTPSGFVPGNATRTVPGTLFATPAPTTTQIHAGISSGCASCHEAPYQWVGMATYYAISPSVLTSGAQYTGFQTRPGAAAGTFIVADSAHPTSGDCSQCHAGNFQYFDGNVKPANHIPTATTATCTNCHKSTNFSVMPALVDIHTYAPSTTTNCAQCHSSANAPTFAIPAAGFSIVTTPANHIPTTASCETCHVGANSSVVATPVPNGAKFANSAMSHAGITTCVTCHGPTLSGASFAGITKLTVMPPTSPVGAGSHIPSATTCETCHLGSVPSGLVAANATTTAPGTLFATPVPTTTMIHGSITSGCTSCHESNYLWMDVSNYPIAPKVVTAGAQYTGFQTRPTAAGGTYAVPDAAHPTTGDCVTCHGASFNYFTAQAEPSNHIPTLPGAACSVCHTTAGNFAVYTTNLTTLHTEVSTACSTCHDDGKGPFAGAPGFSIVQRSTRGTHIPITNAGVAVECSGCHKSVTSFAGTIMSHMAIGDSATSAAGNACDACHEYGFRSKFYGISINFTRDSSTHHICGAPGTPTAPNVTICATNGGSDCLVGCHEHNSIPSTYKVARPPRVVTPAVSAAPGKILGTGDDAGRPTAAGAIRAVHANIGVRPCQSCHNGVAASGKAATHPAANGACADCHSTLAWRPVVRVDHADVLARCVTCHNGTRATAKPAKHPVSGTDCDSCHTTSAWRPAAFDHGSVLAGTCATCHNAVAAPGKPANHVLTTLSCDSCHYTLGWLPLKSRRPLAPTSKPAVRPPSLPRPAQPPTPRLP